MQYLRDQLFDDPPMDVGQPEVAAGVAVGEASVVAAEELENRGVQVVNMDRLFDGLEAEFVSRAVGLAPFDAAAGEPGGEAPMIVVAAVDLPLVCAFLGHLDDRRAAKLASPED